MNIAKKFVLKCNHGTGYNILVNDESSFDVEKANQLINRRMNIKMVLFSEKPNICL